MRSVKSQVAAAHFNRIAKERGLPYSAVSRGIGVDGSIPTLLFDAVRYGDQIEFTVQTIEGAKTIVSLRRE